VDSGNTNAAIYRTASAQGIMFQADWDMTCSFCLTYWQWGNGSWANYRPPTYTEFMNAQFSVASHLSFDEYTELPLTENGAGHSALLTGTQKITAPRYAGGNSVTAVLNLKLNNSELTPIFATNYNTTRYYGMTVLVSASGVVSVEVGNGGLKNLRAFGNYILNTPIPKGKATHLIICFDPVNKIRAWVEGVPIGVTESFADPDWNGRLSSAGGTQTVGYLDDYYWDYPNNDLYTQVNIDELFLLSQSITDEDALKIFTAQKY
jgi:hypothetical protein